MSASNIRSHDTMSASNIRSHDTMSASNIRSHDTISASNIRIDSVQGQVMRNSVSLKFREAQIWKKLPNVFKIIKHCTPFKKCVAYEVFSIRYFSNTKHNSARKKILDNVFQSNCSSHTKIRTNPSKIKNGLKFDIGWLCRQN